jgi:hypothetical protein
MAVRRKPPVRTVKFELTFSGIAGIGVVCFCIFLWMFLLGVWTGQSLLLPSSEPEQKITVAQQIQFKESTSTERLHIEAGEIKKVNKNQQ